jgi:hypothetical protein
MVYRWSIDGLNLVMMPFNLGLRMVYRWSKTREIRYVCDCLIHVEKSHAHIAKISVEYHLKPITARGKAVLAIAIHPDKTLCYVKSRSPLLSEKAAPLCKFSFARQFSILGESLRTYRHEKLRTTS